ncbi:MAG: TRAP transporter substrate-binding protein [Clostridiales Family XIII bacterium]|jgi:TRAP-type C4-dicarboxylate transport system substrate-binding protein|nr:TRAP transporter substrate-binding protein [Clostridiales Family XIII bacterium]
MMKKRLVLLLAVVMVFAAGLSACGGGGGNESASDEEAAAEADGEAVVDDTVYEFKMDIPDPPESIVGTFVYKWVEDVQAASNGRIVITVYPSSQLGAVPDIIDNLKNGVSDIAWASPAMFSGRFPVMEGTNLPMLDIPDSKAGTDLLYDLYEQTDLMQKEFDGLHPLMLYNACQYYFATAKGGKQINSLADLKGLKIRAQGTYPSILIRELGGEPISLHASEVYESLSKNVLDGMLSDLTTYKTWKLDEVTGHVVESQIYRFCAFLLMNPDAYAKLPDDLKAVLDSFSGREAAYGFGDAFTTGAETGIELYRAAGATTSEFSEEDLAKIDAAAQVVNDQWITDMDAAGYDGQAVLDTYNELLANINS